MLDTKHCYETINKLKEAVNNSVKKQYMISEEDDISVPVTSNSDTEYILSPKRTFEAASAYKGSKTAVLNFANNQAIGGKPFSSKAQEESLCRCSTLLPCLEAMEDSFYVKHRNAFDRHELDFKGNDDIIYTPDVVVFKTDERTNPIKPQIMPENDWYKVNVITCAAPDLRGHHKPANYTSVIESRIKRILDVAAREDNEVLILGAWGCGAFKNDSNVVAKTFKKFLRNYNFKIVEFAMSTLPSSNSPFFNYFGKKLNY